MRRVFILILLSVMVTSAKTQNNKNTFDFWLGTWDAYWNDSLKGTNTITKTLNNLVIEENFVFNDKTFKGRSWTVYDTTKKIWKQIWVDDQGAYLHFTGGSEGDKVILSMEPAKDKKGKMVTKRMVFYNIKPDSFDWDWQSSSDKKKWKSNWLINYKRREK